ncbi:hypothetical protein [Bathymodiolus septemdierum thioautotrophic gill symbiont]|nr:hypothetical protein [Bathymodiolus septemdierum thioautotrophic gill symbiont]
MSTNDYTDIFKILIDLFHFKDGVLESKGMFSKTSAYYHYNQKSIP